MPSQIKFTQVIKDNLMGTISSVTQDRQGYIWFAAGTNASTIGLYRYDGVTTTWHSGTKPAMPILHAEAMQYPV